MRFVFCVVTVAWFLLCPVPAQCWGDEGHRTVALIAQQPGMLSAKALAGIKGLVGDIGLVPLATCPDEIRSHERNPSFVLSPACVKVFPMQPTGTAGWHFVDLDVTKTDPADAAMDAFCNNDCVVAKILAFQQVLGDSSAQPVSRAQALSFLVHFVGDIHQPLHAAERNNDRGGNLMTVNIPPSPGSAAHATHDNLHSTWDTFFVSMIGGNEDAVASKIAAQIATAKQEPVPQSLAAWVHAWVRQSEDLARTVAYQDHNQPLNPNPIPTLSADYERTAMDTIEGQLARAGVRLAALINAALRESGCGPQRPCGLRGILGTHSHENSDALTNLISHPRLAASGTEAATRGTIVSYLPWSKSASN